MVKVIFYGNTTSMLDAKTFDRMDAAREYIADTLLPLLEAGDRIDIESA